MMAKIIVHGADRPAALAKLQELSTERELAGIETNLEYLRAGLPTTRSSQPAASPQSSSAPSPIIAAPSTFSNREPRPPYRTIPGRLGFWHVGVPPSGPMDS